jgi:heme-degrading monooxygenase HmoA
VGTNSKNRRTEEPNVKLRRGILFLLVLWFFGSSVFAMSSAAQENEKVLRHIVMYKFKDTVTPAQVQEVIDAFAGLPKKIDTIVGFEAGTNVSPEGKSGGFTHVFVVTFKSVAARDAYLTHPAHQAYVQVVKDRREKVIVFDYWAAK